MEHTKMTLDEFADIVSDGTEPVVLLEGRREIPDEYVAKAKEIGSFLARLFPDLHFRSGNATGSDEAFSSGVADVDAGRLQIIAPYKTHREKSRYLSALYDSPESMSVSKRADVVRKTLYATPRNKGLFESAKKSSRLVAKATYLIRDTMKATGHSRSFPKPVAALFYVKLADPEAGGTGHTIRVCRQEGVPCIFQDSWENWIKC